ncbi:hypothetical protein [uncultured Psychroserpens sp.]|uniref:hypothetical protein n=1 Tax=uncultured Psychroserpens sp. TaxID=255436 RepID=UPI0026123477|nr:hypothetical protein [uncultured Psychroserpens sp.]
MIMIITLTLSILVVINFILLAFSCNKVTKKKYTEKPKIENTITSPTITASISTKKLASSSRQLAPTGS